MNLGVPVFEAKDDGGGGDNWTTGAISGAKLQPNHHHQHPVGWLVGLDGSKYICFFVYFGIVNYTCRFLGVLLVFASFRDTCAFASGMQRIISASCVSKQRASYRRDSRFEACCNISLQLLLSRCKRAFAVKVGVHCRGKGQCSRGERTVLKEFSAVTRTHIPQLHSATLFSHNYYVVWARRYCDQSVTVYVCVYVGVWFCVSTIKRKPMIGMT